MDKSVLYKLSYGLYAIGAQGGACIVNTVFQITSTPAVIALSMNKDNATHDLIKNQGHFSVSILNEDVPPEIIRVLGFTSSRDTDKFSGLPWKYEQGLPVLLSVKAELWEEASARVGPAGVVALGRPFSRAVFAQAVGMLRAAQAQVGKLREENKKLRQKLEELRAVSRAKCLLVEYLHLDEESAHKYIERAAMEERKTRRAVAEEIIAEYG